MANRAYGPFCSTSSTLPSASRPLHLGCGPGYYTAVAAELVGQMGKITAIEIDPGLAEKARAALMPWPQITVSNADGANLSFDPVDLIIASAGATHPLSSWLDALKLGGRLPFPMNSDPARGDVAGDS
jgi:protein-L-isoaspartate(D-aspartate) O-methyltransferase